jgi:Arc/MetJ-type ribon-helix-helix transcriptional regulator
MKIKLCPEARAELQTLGKSKNIWIEGSVAKLLDDCDGEFSEYIKSAIENDTSKRKKRLEITKQVQDQNKELQKKADENDSLMVELKEALRVAEEAKETALSDLDVMQRKSQFQLIGSIVKYALWVIVGTGIITTALYTFAITSNSSETTLIGNTWSNLFGILLTNSFSIIGTIMGVKYANKEDGDN